MSSLWDKVRDWASPSSRRARRDVRAHIKSSDPKKWDRFVTKASSPEFIRQLEKSKDTDDKLVLHAVQMGALQKAPKVSTVKSDKGSGKTYEIRKLPGGALGCTCNDWRYKGSVTPGYTCKHIRAFRGGMAKLSSFSKVTSGFFDELQKIRDAAQSKGSTVGQDHARPYSNLLTMGEEPSLYNPHPISEDAPDVIIGGSR